MPTVTLNAYSKSFPSITNRIRASIALTSSPSAIIASIIDTTVGHPQRVWSFPGLNRNNYDFSLDEIDSSGNPINNLALFSVTPGQLNGQIVRYEEQPQVDVTPGFVSGTNTFTFDGTETFPGSGILKPDYLGWDITPSELTGRGILVDGTDYSWNKVTGVFNLLLPGDVFQSNNFYNIYFEPQLNPAGFSVSTINDFQFTFVNSTSNLSTSDFGKKVIVEPGSGYIELTLPLLSTVPEGRYMMVENSGSASCAKFLTLGSDIINFAPGLLMALSGESFYIYKYTRIGVGDEYRVCNADGNFKRVGESVSDDNISGLINKKLLDGRDGLLSSEDERLYQQFVLNLPLNQVCNYDDWTIGNNKYLYSFANSANPANANKFKFPDRRDLYERNNKTGKSGDYLDDDVKPHKHKNGVADNNAVGRPFVYGWTTDDMPGSSENPIQTEGNPLQIQGYTATDAGGTNVSGVETRPKSYLINKYVLI
jgi:hypothetical protein